MLMVQDRALVCFSIWASQGIIDDVQKMSLAPLTDFYILTFFLFASLFENDLNESVHPLHIRTHSKNNNIYIAFNVADPDIRPLKTWVFNTRNEPTHIGCRPIMPPSSFHG